MRTRALASAALATAASLTLLAAAAPTPAHAASTTVVISEVQSRAPNVNPNIANAVELLNLTSSSISLDNWVINFYDSSNVNTAAFQFPVGTSIPAHGFVIITDSNFNPAPRQLAPQVFNYSLVGGATDGLPDDGGVEIVDAAATQIDGAAMSLGASTPLEGNPATGLNSSTDQFNASIQRDVLGGDTDDNAVDFNRIRANWGATG